MADAIPALPLVVGARRPTLPPALTTPARLRCARFLPGVLCVLATWTGAIAPARASRTGLNNIPIAAVSEPGAAVVQAYSAFGDDRKPSFLSGARAGLEAAGEHFELGFDSRWKPGAAVPMYFNAKWASHWSRTVPALGLGFASVGLRRTDRQRLGQPQSYTVLSHALPLVRVHGGYTWQSGNNSCFAGFDHTWQLAGHGLTLRSDILQIQDRSQWLGSVGLTYKVTPRLGFEVWDSIPTERGKSYLTLKLGYSHTY